METKKPIYDESKEALIEVIEKGKKQYKVVPLPKDKKENLEEIQRPEEVDTPRTLTIEERVEELEKRVREVERSSRK